MAIVRIEPPLSVTPETSISLELLDANSRVLDRTQARGADFHGGAIVLVDSSGMSLPAGSYTLRLRIIPGPGSSEAEVVTYPFRLGRER
jgi:hypothetical protein